MASEDGLLTRRGFLEGAAGAFVAASFVPGVWAAGEPASLGGWHDDGFGLPCYRYTGALRFPSSPVENDTTMLPDDPVFLLGNNRLTLFAHASGLYQVVTGERSWGRVNQGDSRWSGSNQAVIEFGGAKHNLIGLDEPAAVSAEKYFGVGFARYDYTPGRSLKVRRVLSVAPSVKVDGGSSAFLVQVRLHNTGTEPIEVRYAETTRAQYQQLFATWSTDPGEVTYTPQPSKQLGADVVQVSFIAKPRRKLAFPPAGQMSRLEQFPPSLFVKSLSTEAHLLSQNDAAGHPCIGVSCTVTLKPGEQRDVAFVTGYSRDVSSSAIDALTSGFHPASVEALGSAFGADWQKALPAFSDEKDAALRREMRWNAAMLAAMATWREYYDETIIPQGTVYDYIWGVAASSRDMAQQALPMCHINPAVARSTLRYIMKRILPDGEVKLNDQGFGWVGSGAQQTSDQQLFFFLLLAEYLRVTRDTSILTDEIEYYPRECSGRDTGLAHVRQAFLFLRDRVSVGSHGIVRRWNSDWNDMFFFWPTSMPYNRMFESGESHMNSAMAIVILGDLATTIDSLHDSAATELTAAMREYRTQLNEAWMADLGDRKFPRRAWTDNKSSLGDDNMWLEPQGFALLIPEFSTERKRQLYAEVERRLLAGEAMGARQIETPVTQPGTPPGSRENGGFWYALNGPLVLGVATFDPQAAEGLMRRMTFANYARAFPNYWTGQWTASDALDSALLKTNGLSENIVFCAHAHAWPLYCYLRLRSTSRT